MKSFLIANLLGVILLSGCMANLRPKTIKQNGITDTMATKGEAILREAWLQQGLDKLTKFKTYSYTASDEWQGLMGSVGKVWGDKKTTANFKYEIGTFNGQVTFLDGKHKNTTSGIQNWKYYTTANGTTTFPEKENKRHVFGLAAFQYFIELSDRLLKAPIISYGGSKKFNGDIYDLVFATWHKTAPHKQHDQYVLWINQSTKALTYCEFTIRDNYLKAPGAGAFYGSIHFQDFKTIQGIKIPHKQTVYFNSPKEKGKPFLHEVNISTFDFDNFKPTILHPSYNTKNYDDEKPN